ncbi:MAG: YggS family pyridoxal phosphate-dependent enzyme [Robiginitomaculum sp.]|nr:YggS family pyridoxal phosphate-dependent enzyme [Robiginitomaculum sp.]
MVENLSYISDRRKQISQRIEVAAKSVGRDSKSISLIAVSKRQTQERIDALWLAGHRVYGENLVDEAERRWQGKRKKNLKLQLHLIGHLQSNKAERAVALFDVIETLDSLKLAKKLSAAMKRVGKRPQFLVQVNTGEESQKFGVLPNELFEFLKRVGEETDLNVSGLMCIPPKNDEAGLHFALLAKLAKQHGLENLSMGMSEDYETAIRFGATSIRVGSALFGDREI